MATRARAAVTLAVALLGAAVSVGMGPAPLRLTDRNQSDIVAFQGVVTRVRNGAPYYAAMAEELRTRGYPMQSPFNWRTPLHLMVVAQATAPAAGVALVILALVSSAGLWLGLPSQGRSRTFCGALLVGTLLVTAAPDLVFLPETWSGVLIAGSVAAFAHRRVHAGVGAGLAALALRELAAPYCVACTVMAVTDRDWTQVRAWLVGAVAYGVYFGWHVTASAALTHPGDHMQVASWLNAGGVPAVLAAMRWTSWWFLATPAALPLLFTLVIAGIVAAGTPRHARAAAGAYLGFLMIAGQPFNHYWGLMAAPTWAFVAGCGAAALVAATGEVRAAGVSAPPHRA